MVILGGSGTGKSVLLKILLQLIPMDSGTITINGTDIHAPQTQSSPACTISMLFQNSALFDSLTVGDNITFGLHALSPVEKKSIVEHSLHEVNLPNTIRTQYPSELSGGMQKRVALARTIAQNPDIILFDEPTTGLDPITARIIDTLIAKTIKNLGATAITITHDLNSVRRTADMVAFLYQGSILWTGTPDEMDTTDNAHIKQFRTGTIKGPIRWM